MYTLYIDTHFIELVLAIFNDEKIINIKKMNSDCISKNTIPLLSDMLNECNLTLNDLKEVIVISGPGSFTGIRIGIVIAKIIAYSLHISVKSLTYLQAMDLSYNEDIILGIKDRNGAFIGEFDKDNNLKKDYYYLNNKELENVNKNIVFDTNIDLKKVKQYVKNLESIHPHSLVPLYVKRIEVESC